MLLVGLGRAGSKELEKYFVNQIEEIQLKRTQVKERIKIDRSLTPEAQMRYYSAWYYSAIHIAPSVPSLQTKEAIAVALGLAPAIVGECLEFLTDHALVIQKTNRYSIGPVGMHLSANSPMITKLHANWRLQALQSLAFPKAIMTDLHYSTVLTISQEDAKRVRETLLRTIEQIEKIFRPSPEEAVYCIGMDWFQVSNHL